MSFVLVAHGKFLFSDFDKAHSTQWGQLVEPKDVKIEWHGKLTLPCQLFQKLTWNTSVPNAEEVDFVLQILDRIASPTLDKVEALVNSSDRWDSVSRNDFCRWVL